MKSFLIIGLTLFFTQEAIAASHYYPSSHLDQISNKTTKGETLKDLLFDILIKKHVRKGNQRDILVNNCGETEAETGKCYGHHSLGYKGARKVLFGNLHLEEDSNGYFVKDVYCRKKFSNQETSIGPNTIPSHSKINCEHTWPQSKFSKRFPKGIQKSDLHHLFPTDSKANSTRGNNQFADVDGYPLENNCESSYTGVPTHKAGFDYFEPPVEHKGNVARALFYFSIRYKIAISPSEEAYLRQWHIQDPVDAKERERNDKIFNMQKNRNPFIDFPELVERISDF